MPLLVVNTQMAIPLKSNRRMRWKRKHSFTASKPVILIEKVERAVGDENIPKNGKTNYRRKRQCLGYKYIAALFHFRNPNLHRARSNLCG